MKPIDGQHRRGDPDDHSLWCRNTFDLMAERGIWGVPRSGLTFQRRGNMLVLVKRATGHDARDQQGDFAACQRQFAKADIKITDETEGKQS